MNQSEKRKKQSHDKDTTCNNEDISMVVDETDEIRSDSSSGSSAYEIKEKIKYLSDNSKRNIENFKKYNNSIINKVIDNDKNDEKKMNLNYEKDFNDHLEERLNELDERLNILQMKYNSYKKWYDRFNILIIMISSLLSVYEAFKLELLDIIEEDKEELRMFLNLIPIVISSSITCSAAIIKFKKYQEKMENMQFTREKVINSLSKLKYVQESLWFSNNQEKFEEIKIKYLDDVYGVYNESSSELERHIKFNDYHKFLKMYRPPPNQEEKQQKKKEKKSKEKTIDFYI